MSSCRKDLQPLTLSSGSNAGLLLARYLKEQKAEGDSAGIQAREELLTAAASIVGKAGDFYKAAFEQRGKILGGLPKTFHVEGRMIIGLGASNVLETGLTLNHLYGTPIIPGSALKGLAAHYCSSVWGVSEPGFRGPSGGYYKFIFGSTEEEGFLTFHDAWITPELR
ncbi:hypothetical protein FACS1894187_23690 [Synergistales bacterium]|nr:hypothetical protein FACS1894187_23690 [Synergistales bacterium]